MDTQERIRQLEEELQDLKRRWPAHSLKPAMFRRLEELEEELDSLKSRQEHKSDQGTKEVNILGVQEGM